MGFEICNSNCGLAFTVFILKTPNLELQFVTNICGVVIFSFQKSHFPPAKFRIEFIG